MKITHVHDKIMGRVAYSCEATGKTVIVSMVDIRELKSTEQLHKMLTDRGLFDRPKYPKHPRCTAVYDRYREGVVYDCEATRKFCFVPLDTAQKLDEQALDDLLTENGLFQLLTVVEAEKIETTSKVLDLMEALKDARDKINAQPVPTVGRIIHPPLVAEDFVMSGE